MVTVAVYFSKGNKRSELIAQAAVKGIKKAGANVILLSSHDYKGVIADYAVFYGLSNGLDRVFADYKALSAAVYIDLGYWNRRITNRYDGYHKISVNSRHPTEYFQQRKHNNSRFRSLHVEIKPWKKDGKAILVAGLSNKAALAEHLMPGAWEKEAIRIIQQQTAKVIRFRPKPNCCRTRPIPGTLWHKKFTLEESFENAYAVVARHSNVCVDAILEGIPVFCETGVASAMSGDIHAIEAPYYPGNREQWAADIAWTQFTPAEMATALPWTHLKDEGLFL